MRRRPGKRKENWAPIKKRTVRLLGHQWTFESLCAGGICIVYLWKDLPDGAMELLAGFPAVQSGFLKHFIATAKKGTKHGCMEKSPDRRDL